jgi:hypothetical protein
MPALYKYRVYCKSEKCFHTVWNSTPPISCPININHEIDEETITIIETFKRDNITISNVDEQTKGYFLVETKTFDVPADTPVSKFTFSYKFPVAVYRATIITGSEHNGDSLSIVISPDTPIGVLTTDIEKEQKTFGVSSTVIQNAVVGFYMAITDGTNYDDLGVLTFIDYDKNEITVENAPTTKYVAGDYILLNVHIVKNLQLPYPYKYDMGSGVLSGKPIPPNTISQITYNNSNGLSKKLYVTFEYTY